MQLSCRWKNRLSVGLLAGVVAAGGGSARAKSTSAAAPHISVDAAHPAHAISPTLWGIFFEDINLSADGGIYPELVRNRSFEDADHPENWTFKTLSGTGSATIATADVGAKPALPPLNAFNRKALAIKAGGAFSLINEGYWGMNLVANGSYTLKFAARADKYTGKLTARLLSNAGKVLAEGVVDGFKGQWEYHTLKLTPSASDAKGKLELTGEGQGTIYLDMVSLLPDKTWKDHGLRPDLAESLVALHPRFMRFPGGCWVEGDDFAHMNHWKNTIGNLDTRTPLWNIWGYYATHGLGFHEYLQLAEDLGAEPLFDINVGMSHKESVPMDRMAQWVQDALDAVEYANGPTNTVWGAMRAQAGHPEPFHLRYMEIGNENGGETYRERWPLFVNAIHARYPEIKFIANNWLNGYPTSPKADVVDEHFYDSPEWFMHQANHFDHYDRTGPKIFVGEYAVTRNCGLGNLRGAIGEAAFMTGLERNSDHVIMASYAPLLVNLNHRAWNPDLINFDSANWYGLPSYSVQQLFAANRGDQSLPTTVTSPLTDAAPEGGLIGVGTWNTAAEFKDVKVTSLDGKQLFASDFSHDTKGWKLLGEGAQWKVQDGALRQTAEREFIRAMAGQKDWHDYTLTLKARKISGAEGFLILFRLGGDEDRTWWNIGGWSNTADGIEAGGTLDSKSSHIDTGRWYDIKVTVSGKNVKCWLDGELIHDVNLDLITKVDSLYSVAATDQATGDLILKVVNANPKPLTTDIELKGVSLAGTGTAQVLTSESGADENTLEEPRKVAPKTEAVNVTGGTWKRTFPGNSLTVIRLQTK
ncbi:MAG TPA: alpha-L-arabinofuranosidase C-terminal domain-containing protein [Verrucomicrobiae bacterium]